VSRPLGDLLARLNEAGPAQVGPALLSVLNREIGATGVRLLFADVEERVLIAWGEAGERVQLTPSRTAVEGSVHGQVYLTGRSYRGRVEGEAAVVAPIVARSERIGVVEVRLAVEPDDRAEELVSDAGLMAGYFVLAGDRWTDEFQVARRRRDMSLAAEYQWSLLPLAAFSTPNVSLAGALEPAYDIAGDSFDYSFGRYHLIGGIFDAMGHGLDSAALSAIAITSFRNARRAGRELEEQARFIHQSVESLRGGSSFVTGQLLNIDLLDPGRSTIVNAGHPVPFMQRAGEAAYRPELGVDLPFGMPFETDRREQRLALTSGDRLTLFSDGVIEARPEDGEPFSEARLGRELEARRSLSPRETARQIIMEVRRHRGAELVDDATILIIDVSAAKANGPSNPA
jgi:hypothetical protein